MSPDGAALVRRRSPSDPDRSGDRRLGSDDVRSSVRSVPRAIASHAEPPAGPGRATGYDVVPAGTGESDGCPDSSDNVRVAAALGSQVIDVLGAADPVLGPVDLARHRGIARILGPTIPNRSSSSISRLARLKPTLSLVCIIEVLAFPVSAPAPRHAASGRPRRCVPATRTGRRPPHPRSRRPPAPRGRTRGPAPGSASGR